MTPVTPDTERFLKWLDDEMTTRGLNDHRLSRLAGFASGVMGNVRSGKRSPGWDLLLKIANALDVPSVIVFQIAGKLPADRDWTSDRDELLYLFDQLDDNAQEDILAQVRAIYETRKKKEREG